MDAAVLDELEAAGQSKRLVARVCAELHNAIRNYGWARTAKEGERPPEPLHESQFLPVKIRAKQADKLAEARKQKVEENLRSTMNAMCGF